MNEKERLLMFSSASDEWETPDDLYQPLDEVMRFTCDPAASHLSHKHPLYWTLENDAFEQDWSNHRFFINPPYSTAKLRRFGSEMFLSYLNGVSESVFLVAARTDTEVWHYNFFEAPAAFFFKGRLKMENHLRDGVTNSAPFPSALVFNVRDIQLIRKAAEAVAKAGFGGILVWF